MVPLTQADVAAYVSREHAFVTAFYENRGLSANCPERRARELGEAIGEGLTMLDHSFIMQRAFHLGRPTGLNDLEDLAELCFEEIAFLEVMSGSGSFIYDIGGNDAMFRPQWFNKR